MSGRNRPPPPPRKPPDPPPTRPRPPGPPRAPPRPPGPPPDTASHVRQGQSPPSRTPLSIPTLRDCGKLRHKAASSPRESSVIRGNRALLAVKRLHEKGPMRNFAILITGLVLAMTLSACQKTGVDTAYDMTQGNPKAKVVMVEYSSVACPHCARFNNEVFPAFKAKYIDTGRVYYISREVLIGNPEEGSIAAAGILTAHCAGKDKYFQVTDDVFHAMDDIMAPGNQPHEILQLIAQSAGP